MSTAELKTLRLAPGLEAAVRSGHPWVYRNHVPPNALRGGEWVRVEAGRGAAYGVYDGEGAIAVRLYGATRPARGWLGARVATALELREHLPGTGTDAYRLIYGEGDFLPGIVCDRYGRYAIMKRYSASLDGLLPEVAKEVGTRLKLKGVALRSEVDDEADGPQSHGLTALWGELRRRS